MQNPIRPGNKAALIVGLVFFVADNIPFFHQFGAWLIGCLFCFYYSVSAIAAEKRASQPLKYGLYAFLTVLLVLAIVFHEDGNLQGFKRDWTNHPALKVFGVEAR